MSVIIPTFNREKYIYSTLLCLINQIELDDINYEIIIIDSGNDETKHLVQQFIQQSNVTIKYKKIKNCSNRSLIRNVGAKLASSEILLFLDNDILIPQNYISFHYKIHNQNKFSIVCGRRKSLIEFNIDEFGYENLVNKFSKLDDLPWYEDERMSQNTQFDFWRFVFSHSLSIHKKDFFYLNGFNKKFGNNWGFEDLELGYKAQVQGMKFIFLKEPAVYHQPHFVQSKNQQKLNQTNLYLFKRIHNCFEFELCTNFSSRYEEYFKIIKKIPENLCKPSLDEMNCFDYIFSAVYTKERPSLNPNVMLGVIKPKIKNKNKCKVLILCSVFFMPFEIQVSIIETASSIVNEMTVALNRDKDIRVLKNIYTILGYKIEIEKLKNYAIVKIKEKTYSKIIHTVLPDVLDVERRLAYKIVLQNLKLHGFMIATSDIKSIHDYSTEEFSISENYTYRLENSIEANIGKYNRIFLMSLSNYVRGVHSFKDEKNTFVINDLDFEKNKFAPPNVLFKDSVFVPSHIYQNLIFASVKDLIFSTTLSSKKYIEKEETQYITFMGNGFYEDGIDVVLAWLKRKKQDSNFRLTVKCPDVKKLLEKSFPRHNYASWDNKNFDEIINFDKQIYLLKKAIEDFELSNFVIIKNINITFNEVVSLITESDVCIFTSRGVNISPLVYASIILGRETVICEQQKIPECCKQRCKIVHTFGKSLSECLRIPKNIYNINHLAFDFTEEEFESAILQENKVEENIDFFSEKINFESLLNIFDY